MHLIKVGTIGCLFSLPFYILWICKPPESIATSILIWSMLLFYFMIIKEDT